MGEWQGVVQTAFYGIVGICAVSATKSLISLNIKMAVIVKTVDDHDKRIDRLEILRREA